MAKQIREIILDTETTGLYAKNGDRIIEVGCIELINRTRTGKYFHKYINPKCEIAKAATAVHGITSDQLKDKPTFDQIVKEMLEFFGDDSSLVIHNAGFDMSFLNMEFGLCNLPPFNPNRVIDTLNMARKKFPGSPASLDALCKRFKVSLSTRNKHGALIDADLLAAVYLNLVDNGQTSMNLFADAQTSQVENQGSRQMRPERAFAPSEDELSAHEKLLLKITDPLWKKII